MPYNSDKSIDYQNGIESPCMREILYKGFSFALQLAPVFRAVITRLSNSKYNYEAMN